MQRTHFSLTLLFIISAIFCIAQPSVTLKPGFQNSTYDANISENERASIRKQWEIDDKKIQEHVKANNIEDDIYWLKSGLYYSVEQKGSGEVPTINSSVKVKYNLTTLNGTQLWSTNKTGGTEIRPLKDFVYGVAEGLQLLKPGGKMKLFIPSTLAYGTKGWGKKIPPNTCIIYDIELLEVHN